ncbi:hypothetical protein QYE80_24625 [Pseudomonas tohonis]|nr:hypothetical protein L682_01100 [Pseudomonas alcaligenes OT 69]MDN4148194.1 hypothetical protein [Pseudomonas tohonis]
MTLRDIGMFVWGGITVGLAAFALYVLWQAGAHIVLENGEPKLQPFGLLGLYVALKENDSLVAGILGFSGLAWSHFYKGSDAG